MELGDRIACVIMGIVSVLTGGLSVYMIVLGSAESAAGLAVIWMITLLLTIYGMFMELRDRISEIFKAQKG